jgi:hypothetical protein
MLTIYAVFTVLCLPAASWLAIVLWRRLKPRAKAKTTKPAEAKKPGIITDLQQFMRGLFTNERRSVMNNPHAKARKHPHRGWRHRRLGKARASGRRSYRAWRGRKLEMSRTSRMVNRGR